MSDTDSAGPSSWATISRQPFGTTVDGLAVELFTLTNAQGMRVDITNYGATIVRLMVADRDRQFADVVLGYDTLGEYEAGQNYFGTVVGRCGNRIAGGRFTLGGENYELPLNNEPGGMPCHLHGGPEGFSRKVWKADASTEGDTAILKLTYFSVDGEMGYPGSVTVTVTYRLTPKNTLEVIYGGETDQTTLLNLTQHSYFNLAGAGEGSVAGQILQLPATRFLPTDAGQIPTGDFEAVAGTAFDFNAPAPLGGRWEDDHPQLKIGNGYDHCWVYDDDSNVLKLGGKVLEPVSGRLMEVWTTEPGVQLYTGNWIAAGTPGKNGATYGLRGGFCLETQHFPDAPNHPGFPSIVLHAGETYRSVTEFRFSTT